MKRPRSFDAVVGAWPWLLAGLERPVLFFPVAVVLLVAATFLFPGGRCGLWQWWAAVAATSAFCVLRAASWRRGVASACLFLAFVAVVWLLSNIGSVPGDGGVFDAIGYHQPAIRLMVEGWNPVWEGTAEGVRGATGVDPGLTRFPTLLCMPRGVWYFLAPAYLFTGAHLNILYPLSPFLLMSFAFAVWRAMPSASRAVRAFVVMSVLGAIPHSGMIVDHVVALAGVGLLMTMYDSLANRRLDLPRLAVFTFWMAVAKQTSLLHAAVFWAVLLAACVVLRCGAAAARALRAGVLAAVLAAPVLVSPYVTSWVNFSHPLYPRYTCDPVRFPAKDAPGQDLRDRNADADAMGYVGSWANAFVAPPLVRAFYRLKTGKADFMPDVNTWRQRTDVGSVWKDHSPLGWPHRLYILYTLLALLVLGRAGERFVAICAVAGTLAMPIEAIGFLRYVPWVLCLGAFALPCALACRSRAGRAAAVVPVAFGVAFAAPLVFAHAMRSVDHGYAARRLLEEAPPRLVTYTWCGRESLGNIHLMARRLPGLRNAAVVEEPETDARAAGRGFEDFYDRSFMLEQGAPLERFSSMARIASRPTAAEKAKAFPCAVARTFLFELPASVFAALRSGCLTALRHLV